MQNSEVITDISKDVGLMQLVWSAVVETKALRNEYIIAFLGTIVFVAAQVAEPYIYKIVLDTIEITFKNNTTPYESIFASIPDVISSLSWILFLWLTVSWLSIFVKYYRNKRFHTKLSVYWAEIISWSMSSFLSKGTNFHLTVNNAEKLKIFNRWIDSIYDIAMEVFLKVPKTILLLLGYVWLGIYIRADLTLSILGVLTIFIIIPIYLGNRAHKLQKSATKLWDRMYSIVGDLIMNQVVVKLFARENFAVISSHSSVLAAANAQNKVRHFWGILDALQSSIEMIIGFIVLIFSVLFYLQGLITIGDIVLFLTIASRISAPYIELEGAYREIIKLTADYSKYREVLDLPPEPDTGTLECPSVYANISFRDLSFTYPGTERQVLSGVDITLARGTKTALIGHTGSGKSTLANLLMRFYEPTTGAIFVGDTDIRDIELSSYRAKFAAVFQDTTLFNDTLLKNFEFVRDGITLEHIREACAKANILEFIESLPVGFETIVGERGLKLSGGEKQRVAIARAILADPEILILDEATSALDASTERLVTQALDALMVWRTSLIIAHRLSTIQRADSIYLLEQGKVLASGNHDELYKISAIYAQMVDYQKNGFIE